MKSQLNKSPVALCKLGLTKNKPKYNNSASSQRARILKHLRANQCLSTMQARSELGVLHPPGRVLELRRGGHHIDTHWINQPDDNGVSHRVGLYVYKGKIDGGFVDE